MSIFYHESSKSFHLTNGQVSYIMAVMADGQLEQIYYGKAVHDREDYSYFHEEMGRSMSAIHVEEPSLLCMQQVKQEYPCYGTGDFRMPAITVLQENGSRICHYEYISHEIFTGKRSLAPLPATYVNTDEEADSLEIRLHDHLTQTDLVLCYTIFNHLNVLTRNARIEHHGKAPIILDRALSASVEFGDMDFEMVHLAGSWGRERYIKTRKLEMGIQSIQSIAGASSAEHNPFLALKRPATTQQQGEVYGFNFVYSGNFIAQVEVSSHDITRLTMGIHPEMFSWKLCEGESFQTPEVVMVYSKDGMNGMSQTFHRLYRNNLMRGQWKNQARPILLNNWEATYFDFTEESILKIAAKAKEAGVELFVLDDGWFGTRDDDHRGLGDWYVNLKKLPSGIKGLSEKVEALGLKFGLWVELEMVNKDSDLYRAHPDWIIGTPGRYESHSRHQHVLDYSKKEVVDHIYNMIASIIRESKISYIKWDMNRYITEPYSYGAPLDHQGKMMHEYILGLYDLYTRLTTEFPHILFESCSSGGARFDAALLAFAPQAWTSDDTDASERMKIQYGSSYAYPIVTMGSHVSAVPNHQIYRTTPLATRANVAYFGTFGYELDLNLLSETEMKQVKKQIKFMKTYRKLIQVEGDFYRILNPFEGNETAWMVVAPDKSEAIAAFYQRLNKVNASWLRFRLEGLDPDSQYEVTYHSGQADEDPTVIHVAYGDELMGMGLVIDRLEFYRLGGDFTSMLFTLKKIG